MTREPYSTVPSAAAWLGGLGALPFVCLSIATLTASARFTPMLSFALLTYGAVILSFLGGIRWGLAISRTSESEIKLFRQLGLSVAPSLLAWAALLTPAGTAHVILAVGFVVMLVVDIAASRFGEAPAWYPRLRWPLSCAAVLALLLGSLA